MSVRKASPLARGLRWGCSGRAHSPLPTSAVVKTQVRGSGGADALQVPQLSPPRCQPREASTPIRTAPRPWEARLEAEGTGAPSRGKGPRLVLGHPLTPSLWGSLEVGCTSRSGSSTYTGGRAARGSPGGSSQSLAGPPLRRKDREAGLNPMRPVLPSTRQGRLGPTSAQAPLPSGPGQPDLLSPGHLRHGPPSGPSQALGAGIQAYSFHGARDALLDHGTGPQDSQPCRNVLPPPLTLPRIGGTGAFLQVSCSPRPETLLLGVGSYGPTSLWVALCSEQTGA